MFEELKRKIDSVSVVSFDVFDTLLLRNIYQPKDIFKILAREFADDFDETPPLATLRIAAERESRTSANNYETTFDEIYETLERYLKNPALVKKIKSRELELEERFLIANPSMRRVFDYCLKTHKKIYLISDMYLDPAFLNKILKRAGYKKYKLFVSCEEKASKKRGGLFELVQEKEQLDFSDWLHIGDNKAADVDAPRALGINAYHYKNVRDRSRIKIAPKSIELSILRGLQNNFLYAEVSGKKPDFWTEFGVAFASPIYFGFTFWLYQLTKNDSAPLYFIARDGYLPMKVYEKIAHHENTEKPTDYLRLSRATAVVPTFDEIDPDPNVSLINWIIGLAESNENEIDLTSVYENYDLNPKKYQSLLKLFGIKSIHEKINYDNHHKFQSFIRYIYPDIKIVLAKRRDLLKRYLHKHKVDQHKKFYIVDVGWQCSVQRSLEYLVDAEICGFYFGTDRPVTSWRFPNSFGWFIDHGRPDSYRGKILPKFCMMYEFLFTAPEGTALRLEAHSADSAKNATEVVDAVLDEKESYTPIVEKFQSAALEMIDRYLDYFEFFESFDPGETVEPYEKFLYAHKYEDVLHFAELDASVSVNNTKTPFVVHFSKDYIYENFSLTDYQKLVDESLKSLWPYTYIVDECKTNADFDAFQKDYGMRKVATSNLANQTNLKKLFTNPRKGLSIIKTWLKRKHES